MNPKPILGEFTPTLGDNRIEDRHVPAAILSDIDLPPLLEEQVSSHRLALLLRVVVGHGARPLVGTASVWPEDVRGIVEV